jgi:signal recognition particle subunit SRP54
MHRQMADMMKAMGKKRGALSALFGGGGMPQMPTEIPEGADLPPPPNFPGLPPGGFRGSLPGLPGGLPPGLPDLPQKKKR